VEFVGDPAVLVAFLAVVVDHHEPFIVFLALGEERCGEENGGRSVSADCEGDVGLGEGGGLGDVGCRGEEGEEGGGELWKRVLAFC
jgi:hypothetical protein